eukprot:superscaffoldBa00003771_g17646
MLMTKPNYRGLIAATFTKLITAKRRQALQDCSPWGGQAAVLAAAIAADSSRQQGLGLRLGFLCQEPAVSAASSTSFPPFFEVTPLSSFPASFASVHLA